MFGWSKHVRAYGGWLGSQEPMKDVAACDKLRGGGKQPIIRRCPNGETQYQSCGIVLRWTHRRSEGNLGKWNISVPRGKEKRLSDFISFSKIFWSEICCQKHSVSSGERKRTSPNLFILAYIPSWTFVWPRMWVTSLSCRINWCCGRGVARSRAQMRESNLIAEFAGKQVQRRW